jgi:hypothetical protein
LGSYAPADRSIQDANAACAPAPGASRKAGLEIPGSDGCGRPEPVGREDALSGVDS